MNEAFREYAFGRAFTIHLTEKMLHALARLCKGDDPLAALGLGGEMSGLERRGLVTMEVTEERQRRFQPTRAGLLVYQLLVEAGEYAALEREREHLIEEQHRMWREEYDARWSDVRIRVRDRNRRDLPAGSGQN